MRCITRDLKWGTPVPLAGFEDKVGGSEGGWVGAWVGAGRWWARGGRAEGASAAPPSPPHPPLHPHLTHTGLLRLVRRPNWIHLHHRGLLRRRLGQVVEEPRGGWEVAVGGSQSSASGLGAPVLRALPAPTPRSLPAHAPPPMHPHPPTHPGGGAGSVHGQGQRPLPHSHLPGNAAGHAGGGGRRAVKGEGGLERVRGGAQLAYTQNHTRAGALDDDALHLGDRVFELRGRQVLQVARRG